MPYLSVVVCVCMYDCFLFCLLVVFYRLTRFGLCFSNCTYRMMPCSCFSWCSLVLTVCESVKERTFLCLNLLFCLKYDMIRKLFKSGLILYTKRNFHKTKRKRKLRALTSLSFRISRYNKDTTLTLRHFRAFVRDFSHLCQGRNI